MCAKCSEIDKRIERLRTLAARIQDAQMRDGISGLIAELEIQKAELHLESDE